MFQIIEIRRNNLMNFENQHRDLAIKQIRD